MKAIIYKTYVNTLSVQGLDIIFKIGFAISKKKTHFHGVSSLTGQFVLLSIDQTRILNAMKDYNIENLKFKKIKHDFSGL